MGLRWLKPDPLGYPRNPLAVYLLTLAFASGILQLAGLTTAKAVDENLPGVAKVAWAVLLVLGAGCSLVGMFWPGTVSTGLVLKRTGMFTLAVAALIYAVVILGAVGLAGLTSGGIILGFSFACWVQYRQINERVHQVLELTQGVHRDHS